MIVEITEIVLNYGMPLIVLAKNSQGGRFVGVNYEDPEDGTPYKFYFVHPTAKNLRLFTEQKVDLRYLVVNGSYKKKFHSITWADLGEKVKLEKINIELSEEMLPAPRLFNPASAPRSQSVVKRKIEIDGRWDVADLSLFSDLAKDCYSFAYALTRERPTIALKSIFQRYPWRGGSSSVAFFKSLEHNVASDDSMKVAKMQYASPGFIEFSLRGDVADLIKTLITEINLPDSPAENSYHSARDFLRTRGWLTKAQADMVLTDDQKSAMRTILNDLSDKFGLIDYVDYISILSQNDELAGIKILLAFFRRIKKFADYSATGKAVEIFSQ